MGILGRCLNMRTLTFFLVFLDSYHGQVGTAGLDLVLYVRHLSFPLHPAVLGVAEVAGGVDVSVQLLQWVNAQSRGIQGIVVCGAGAGGEDSQQILAFLVSTLSHLLQQRRGRNLRKLNTASIRVMLI